MCTGPTYFLINKKMSNYILVDNIMTIEDVNNLRGIIKDIMCIPPFSRTKEDTMDLERAKDLLTLHGYTY